MVVAAATKLTDMLRHPSARERLAETEQACSALGKLITHRSSAVETAPLVPLWLAWLPLTTDGAGGREALSALCSLLQTETGLRQVLGADGANLPRVLTLIAMTAGTIEHGSAELDEHWANLALHWSGSGNGANPPNGPTMAEACKRAAAGAVPAALHGKLERLGLL